MYLKSTQVMGWRGEWQDLILIVAYSTQDTNQIVPEEVEMTPSLMTSSQLVA